MKQLHLALSIALALIAGVAVAQQARTQAQFPSGSPSSTANNDSCDIAALPAATLLLPYFEVNPFTRATDTFFTFTNVSPSPQIISVTFWTDRAFPVLTFNIFLTGYDAQALSAYDIVVNGVLPATSPSTGPGSRSLANNSNQNFLPAAVSACSGMPTTIPSSVALSVLNALTIGSYGAVSGIGNSHPSLALGYVTADVVATCSSNNPTSPSYFNALLFDNVLLGDYMILETSSTSGIPVMASPMVHIRATPSGGPAGLVVPTNLPYTFYDRYTPAGARSMDRRQPLPSTFAARFIEAGGIGSINTTFTIWREGLSGSSASSSAYAPNAAIPATEMVRFDEHENPSVAGSGTLPATSRPATSSVSFPPFLSPAGDVAGWMYLNLNNGGSSAYSGRGAGSAYQGVSQNWVNAQMYTSGTTAYGWEMQVVALGNGCSPAPASGAVIRPASNTTP